MGRIGKFILIGIAIILVVFLASTYNSLVNKEEKIGETWGNLQATYQRRTDLVPNLVAVVKGSSEYERNVLTQLAEARSKAANLSVSGDVNYAAFQQLEDVQGELAGAVNNTLGIVEAYPDLKASKNFLYLQTQLEGTERRIKFARNDFNESVAVYNKKVRTFPSNLGAKLFGFSQKEGFRADAGASQAPEIKF